jgi:hypothetical protein
MCGFLAFKGYLDVYIYIYIYIDTHTHTKKRILHVWFPSLQRVFYIYICHEEGPVEVFSFYIFLVQYISGLRYKL